jgi:hypothetical protein
VSRARDVTVSDNAYAPNNCLYVAFIPLPAAPACAVM